jgi:predicted AAA+ superfamily ATPase
MIDCPESPEEKLQRLLEGLEELRTTLDEAIAFIDDMAIEADDRG